MTQINLALQLYVNDNSGKLPQCFDLAGTTVKEASWWYRKMARRIYPTDRNHPSYDQLNVPRSYDGWWNTNSGTSLQKFDPDRCILRCPASPDYYNSRSASTVIPRCYEIDKDRVYDDNYGYNNFGFVYDPNVMTIHESDGSGHTADTSYLYHKPNRYGIGGRNPMEPISGHYNVTNTTCYIGARTDVPEPGGTILLMDYVKADAQPFPGVDDMQGYRFRHGGRANALFVDGHVEGFRERVLVSALGGNQIHWTVKKRR